MNEMKLTEKKDLREEHINKIEVLERVKSLLLLPDLEMATKDQVASFYNTNEKTVMSLVDYHYDEFENDGYKAYKAKDLENLNSKISKITSSRGVFEVEFSNGMKREFSHRGVGLFPRRAILRVGMLLKDSYIAKEVRTQLLNVEEKTTKEQKLVSINEEQELALKIIYAENQEERLIALSKFNEYKNKYISKLEDKVDVLVTGNLTWGVRESINRMVRKLAYKSFYNKFGVAWKKVYDEMLYKHNINIKSRKTRKQKLNLSIFDVLDEREIKLLLKSCVSLCEKYRVNIDDIITVS